MMQEIILATFRIGVEVVLACVTGGTGFIGSHIVRVLLADGHDVRVLHRASSKMTVLEGLSFTSYLGDVTDIESLQKAFSGCDWVFHVAAVADYWQADNEWMFAVNVEGTRNVLEAARYANVKRVIFTSSAATIGLPTDDTPSDESVAFNLEPDNFPYGYSKLLAEKVVYEAVEQGQDVVTLNPSIVIGAGDLNLISGTFIIQIAQSQWLTPLSQGGFGVIDVRDVAASHLAAAKNGRTGERYILNTQNFTTAEWFNLIADVVGVAPPIVTVPKFLLSIVANIVTGLRRLGIQTPLDANQVRLGSRYIYFDACKAQRELHQPQMICAKVCKIPIIGIWHTAILRKRGIQDYCNV
ncbi:MAG: NAD-dependent epimerase/dehydratase family protein [Anaerolineae bacterium]|nr:NAD-dependent epimerase/dehydratase family protein [Anaerolineae bacterium]